MAKNLIQRIKEGVIKSTVGLSMFAQGCGMGVTLDPETASDVNPTFNAGTYLKYEESVQKGHDNIITLGVYEKVCLSDIENIAVEFVPGQYSKPAPFDLIKEVTQTSEGHYRVDLKMRDNENGFTDGESFTFKVKGVWGKDYAGVVLYNHGLSPNDLTDIVEGNGSDEGENTDWTSVLKNAHTEYVDSEGKEVQSVIAGQDVRVRFYVPLDGINGIKDKKIGFYAEFNEQGNPNVSASYGTRTLTQEGNQGFYEWPVTISKTDSNAGNEVLETKCVVKTPDGEYSFNDSVFVK